MRATEQTETQTILEHGQSVWEFSKKIINGEFEGLRFPEWFIENHQFIIKNLHERKVIEYYNIFHDCGKPLCLEIDESGRRHFPNHARISKETWLRFSDNEDVARLIGLDMLLHTSAVEELKGIHLDIKTAFTLIVTSLAEIHSNSQMFGGNDSISFKIKWKKLEKNSRCIFGMFDKKNL